MKDSDMVYSFSYNIPKNKLYVEKTDQFIECRAQLVSFTELNEPFFFVDIEHCNIMLATNVMWQDVYEDIYKIANDKFKELL